MWASPNPQNMTAMSSGRVYMDPSRQATDGTYISRTNLPEVPEVPEQSNLVPQYCVLRLADGGKGAHVKVPVTGPLDAPKPQGDTANYVMVDATNRKVITENKRVVVAAKVPRVPATTAHTMFEDSESMVMHLTAALLSTAGQEVLKTLSQRQLGDTNSVGIFSKTAVRAVAAKIASVAPMAAPTKMDFLVADSDASRKTKGTFSSQKRNLDHVVVVLASSTKAELVVMTCFPTDVTTGTSIGYPTTADQDVAEHTFGQHTPIAVSDPLPTLKW